jgi:hypothetical protein
MNMEAKVVLTISNEDLDVEMDREMANVLGVVLEKWLERTSPPVRFLEDLANDRVISAADVRKLVPLFTEGFEVSAEWKG